MKFLIALCAGLIAITIANPAQAQWRRAESPRFIVYSEGSERDLREYVRKLETYDRILRARFAIPANEWDRKLPIYLVSRRQLREVRPGIGSSVAGVYFPASEDIFAIADRGRDMEFVLLHEYFHHLSLQTGAMAAYPGWLIEGLAEYYMTANISDTQIEIGEASAERIYWLNNAHWIPLGELLTKRPLEIRRSNHAATYYPVAWALTHWFVSDSERLLQLQAYVDATAAGADPVEAMETVTGMSLTEVTRAIRDHLRGRIPAQRYEFEARPVDITVTALSRPEGDLLLLGQRAKVGMGEGEQRDRSLAEVRRSVARHAEEPVAVKLLGHVEAHAGDRAQGEALLRRYLEIRPADVEALQWLATSIRDRAMDGDAADWDLLRQARDLLARAFHADPTNYYTLYLLADTRRATDDYPTENDLETWRQAYILAPQLDSIRLGFASALMRRDGAEEATALLEPLANAPHGGGAAEAARTLIEQARAGEAPLDDATLDAAVANDQRDAEPQPDDDQTAQDDDLEVAV